jgi:hypothetical protein
MSLISQKNLISVQKFTMDTNTFFEFHPSHFVLKDRRTGKLLHGPNRHGLYQFFPYANKHPRHAMVGERVFAFQWHSQLGHPTLKIVHRVLSFFSFQLLLKKTPLFALPALVQRASNSPFLQLTDQPIILLT